MLKVTKAKVQTLANAVMGQCDGLDGLKDNVIGRPDLCTVNLSALRCTGAESDSCLTDSQLESVKTMYEPTSVAGGRYTWPGFPFGGESADPAHLQGWGGFGQMQLGGDFMKYFVAQSATADPLQIDPTQYTSRLDYLVGLIDAVNPDLSQFTARGGKLLLWHGMTDWLITPHNTTDYYNKVVASAGGQAAADQFVEYYQAPGVDHCSNAFAGTRIGVGQGADAVDLVGPMFEWIEKGVKPSSKKIVLLIAWQRRGPRPCSDRFASIRDTRSTTEAVMRTPNRASPARSPNPQVGTQQNDQEGVFAERLIAGRTRLPSSMQSSMARILSW